jgi:hypothetical protein
LDRPAALYFVEQPDLRATFLTINAHDRWGFLIHSLSQYGYTPADFTPERCIALIRQGVGKPDLPVTILGVSAWEASAIVADRYRDRRLFLAGDAAHEMPPTGGFGMNTGVQDVQNLCWKLAAVLKGQAGEKLLDTYHPERQPLGRVITENALENSLSMGRTARRGGCSRWHRTATGRRSRHAVQGVRDAGSPRAACLARTERRTDFDDRPAGWAICVAGGTEGAGLARCHQSSRVIRTAGAGGASYRRRRHRRSRSRVARGVWRGG